ALIDWELSKRLTVKDKQIILSPPDTPDLPGRYRIIINENVRADTFLLDTQTGRIWTSVKYTDLEGEPTVWKLQDRVNSQAELAQWIAQHNFKKEGAK